MAHAALFLLPSATALDLLLGRCAPVAWLVLSGALLPQLVLVPWAWRDARRVQSRALRRAWRCAFFLAGFVAVTAYLVRVRRTPRL